MQLRDIMTRDVQPIAPSASLQEAAEKMKSLDVGSLPVCDGQKVLGVITDRDITIRAVADGGDPRDLCVSEAMTQDIVWCYEDEDVTRAAEIMEHRQIRRLPVMDRNKRLVGIVSLGDLATRQRDEKLAGEALEQISQPGQPQA